MNSLGLELSRNCPHTTHFFYICCGCWGNDFGLLAIILSHFLWFMHTFPFSSEFYCFSILCSSLSSKVGGNRAGGDVPDWCFVQPCYIRGLAQQVNNQKMWRMREQSYRLCDVTDEKTVLQVLWSGFLKSLRATGMWNKNFLCREKKIQ